MHNYRHSPTARIWRGLLVAGLAAGLAAGHVQAQQNEDEWYDPTDWFDGNNVESDDTYNYDPYDFGYDYDFDDDNAYDYSDDWAGYRNWDGDSSYDDNYWNRYSWYSGVTSIDDDTDRVLAYSIYDYTDTSRNDGALASSSGSYDTGDNKSSSSNQQASSGKSGSQKQLARLSGTIQGLRNMDLKRPSGAQGEYTLARVQLQNGDSTVLNLGRASQVKDLELKKGATIEALGRKGNVGGQSVFVVHKLKADGRTLDANPAIRLTAQAREGNRNLRTVQGTVAGVERVQASGNHPGRTLVKLTLENGREETVDLGPAASLQKIGLDEGEHVTVRGRTRKVADKDVLVVNLLKIEGQQVASVGQQKQPQR